MIFKGIINNRFLDVNGDGLLDYVRGEQSYKKVYLNTGSGWQLSSSFVLPQPIVSTYTYKIPYGVYIMGRWVGTTVSKFVYRKPSGMHFAELNGDGLIDIVYGGYKSDKKAYLNNGSNWVESSNLAIPVSITNNGGKQIGVKIVDVNNDGLDDIIKALGDVTTTYINQTIIIYISYFYAHLLTSTVSYTNWNS